MTTYFISDLHLSDAHPELTDKFRQFMASLPEETKGLYILGDLFEYWIGDDCLSDTAVEVANLIRKAKVPVCFMPGNRDFLVKQQFCDIAGMTLLKDPTVIEVDGCPVLLTHGDQLCTLDKNYLRFRQFTRQKWLQWLFMKTPKTLRQAIANKLRNNSAKMSSHKSLAMMDVSPDSVTALLQKHRVKVMIHGHTHRPAKHQFRIRQMPAERYVLGAWENKAEILIWNKHHPSLAPYKD